MKLLSLGKNRFSKIPLKIALSNNGLGGPWEEHQSLFCAEKCIWEATTFLSICKTDKLGHTQITLSIFSICDCISS